MAMRLRAQPDHDRASVQQPASRCGRESICKFPMYREVGHTPELRAKNESGPKAASDCNVAFYMVRPERFELPTY